MVFNGVSTEEAVANILNGLSGEKWVVIRDEDFMKPFKSAEEKTKTENNPEIKKDYNIYELISMLKNMPEKTLATSIIDEKEYLFMLNKDLKNLMIVSKGDDKVCLDVALNAKKGDDDLYMFAFSNFNDEDLLMARFEIVEEKDEWIECDRVTAFEEFLMGNDIKATNPEMILGNPEYCGCEYFESYFNNSGKIYFPWEEYGSHHGWGNWLDNVKWYYKEKRHGN